MPWRAIWVYRAGIGLKWWSYESHLPANPPLLLLCCFSSRSARSCAAFWSFTTLTGASWSCSTNTSNTYSSTSASCCARSAGSADLPSSCAVGMAEGFGRSSSSLNTITKYDVCKHTLSISECRRTNRTGLYSAQCRSKLVIWRGCFLLNHLWIYFDCSSLTRLPRRRIETEKLARMEVYVYRSLITEEWSTLLLFLLLTQSAPSSPISRSCY